METEYNYDLQWHVSPPGGDVHHISVVGIQSLVMSLRELTYTLSSFIIHPHESRSLLVTWSPFVCVVLSLTFDFFIIFLHQLFFSLFTTWVFHQWRSGAAACA